MSIVNLTWIYNQKVQNDQTFLCMVHVGKFHVCLQQVTRDMTGDVTRHVTSRPTGVSDFWADVT